MKIDDAPEACGETSLPPGEIAFPIPEPMTPVATDSYPRTLKQLLRSIRNSSKRSDDLFSTFSPIEISTLLKVAPTSEDYPKTCPARLDQKVWLKYRLGALLIRERWSVSPAYKQMALAWRKAEGSEDRYWLNLRAGAVNL